MNLLDSMNKVTGLPGDDLLKMRAGELQKLSTNPMVLANIQTCEPWELRLHCSYTDAVRDRSPYLGAQAVQQLDGVSCGIFTITHIFGIATGQQEQLRDTISQVCAHVWPCYETHTAPASLWPVAIARLSPRSPLILSLPCVKAYIPLHRRTIGQWLKSGEATEELPFARHARLRSVFAQSLLPLNMRSVSALP